MSREKNTNQARMRRLKKERLAAEAAVLKRKRLTRTLVISAVAVVLVVAAIIGISAGVSSYRRTNEYLVSKISFSSEHYTVDNAMLSYFFYDGYYGFESYFEQQGIAAPDFSESLKKQTFGDGYIWYDYLRDSASAQIRELITAAEAAHDSGIALTDGELDALRARAAAVNLARYGEGVRVEDIERCLSLEALAMKYQAAVTQELAMNEEELEAYFDEYYKFFTTVSFRCLEIPYSDGTEGSGSLPAENAEMYANELSLCTDTESFTSKLKQVALLVNPELTDEQLQQLVDASFVTGYTYSEGDTVGEWLFSEDRELTDTFVFNNESTSSCTAYMLTSLPVRDESATVSIRQILFRPDTYGSDAAAEAKAQEVLAQWTQTKDEELFHRLAMIYSEDASTVYTGGLYEHVSASEFAQYMASFSEWCFSSERAESDCTVLKSDFGYHIVSYIAPGLPSYLAAVRYEESNSAYTEHFEALSEQITVTVNEKNLNKLPT